MQPQGKIARVPRDLVAQVDQHRTGLAQDHADYHPRQQQWHNRRPAAGASKSINEKYGEHRAQKRHARRSAEAEYSSFRKQEEPEGGAKGGASGGAKDVGISHGIAEEPWKQA